MQKILSVAVYVYVGREERQMKEKKKAKEQEAGLLAVALARNLRARDRGWGRRRSDTESGLRPGVKNSGSGRNAGRECYHCRNLGHMQRECLLRPRERTKRRKL